MNEKRIFGNKKMGLTCIVHSKQPFLGKLSYIFERTPMLIKIVFIPRDLFNEESKIAHVQIFQIQKKDYQRSGIRVKRLIRECIISNDIKNIHSKIIKKSGKPLESLNEGKNVKLKRFESKNATRIIKVFSLTCVYTDKNKKRGKKI